MSSFLHVFQAREGRGGRAQSYNKLQLNKTTWNLSFSKFCLWGDADVSFNLKNCATPWFLGHKDSKCVLKFLGYATIAWFINFSNFNFLTIFLDFWKYFVFIFVHFSRAGRYFCFGRWCWQKLQSLKQHNSLVSSPFGFNMCSDTVGLRGPCNSHCLLPYSIELNK